MPTRRILVVSDEAPSPYRAGIGTRIGQIVEELGREFDVKLFVTTTMDMARLPSEIDWGEIIISRPGLLGIRHAWLLWKRRYWLVDLTIPIPIEGLSYYAALGDEGNRRYRRAVRRLRRELILGDRFVVASKAQQLFWSGALMTLRDTAVDVDVDDYSRMIIEAPSGTCSARESTPCVSKSIPVVLWGGGLWPWLDPLTLIKSIRALIDHHGVRCRVSFPGTGHPQPDVLSGMKPADIESLIHELELHDIVDINHEWLRRDEYIAQLHNASIGVCLHKYDAEGQVSWRQRLLDYVAARIPIVVTEGDHLGDKIVRAGGGLSVPLGDTARCCEALRLLLTNESLRETCRRALATVAAELQPRQTMKALAEYCRNPLHAPGSKLRSWRTFARAVVG